MGVTFSFNDGASRRIKAEAQYGLQAAARHLHGEAVNRAPVETGALRASAKVTMHGDSATVSFNTPYAARQHEEVGWAHPGGGQAKYLENAMTDEADTIKQIIAEHIRRAF